MTKGIQTKIAETFSIDYWLKYIEEIFSYFLAWKLLNKREEPQTIIEL
jgi:hypothetical protein